ncbi:hypothetical protein H8D83_01265 [Candidatus Woesearchaeota archaeon]|nr:hypothetical protein [Candidatus Woesearchaeota archaeon]
MVFFCFPACCFFRYRKKQKPKTNPVCGAKKKKEYLTNNQIKQHFPYNFQAHTKTSNLTSKTNLLGKKKKEYLTNNQIKQHFPYNFQAHTKTSNLTSKTNLLGKKKKEGVFLDECNDSRRSKVLLRHFN